MQLELLKVLEVFADGKTYGIWYDILQDTVLSGSIAKRTGSGSLSSDLPDPPKSRFSFFTGCAHNLNRTIFFFWFYFLKDEKKMEMKDIFIV
jgi:hypothetical protein